MDFSLFRIYKCWCVILFFYLFFIYIFILRVMPTNICKYKYRGLVITRPNTSSAQSSNGNQKYGPGASHMDSEEVATEMLKSQIHSVSRIGISAVDVVGMWNHPVKHRFYPFKGPQNWFLPGNPFMHHFRLGVGWVGEIISFHFLLKPRGTLIIISKNIFSGNKCCIWPCKALFDNSWMGAWTS